MKKVDIDKLQTEEMILNMGPQHPSTHGILHLILKVDGEKVYDVKPNIGYLHRCAEKIAENVTYSQFVPYTDRLDYLASMNMNLGYCIAVEKLLGYEIPLRAEYIRVIMAELNRIASHLVAIGTYGIDIGATTPFLYCFRERERILDLFESVCGARLTYNYICIGGVRADLPEGFLKELESFLNYFEPRLKELNELLTYNPIFIDRTSCIGVLPQDVAINYGVSGPCLRGSGVKWDIRKGDTYSIYSKFDFDIPVGTGEMGILGDCWDRYYVRIREMEESVKILRQALSSIPDGEIKVKVPKVLKVPPGEVYCRTESPRGELGFYIISDGSEKPYRVKIRSGAFSNLSVINEISYGALIADMIAILGSLDIVLGEIDR
jgi:NADH-quinone oxidoreductase subunit D